MNIPTPQPRSAAPRTFDKDEMLELLHELISVCRGGERGYRRAAEAIQETVFQSLLRCYADQRAQFVAVLETLVDRFGGAPSPRDSVIHAIQRTWSDLLAALAFGGDRGVLEACARGEDAARLAYETALKRTLPVDVRGLIEQQLANIREAQERLHSLQKVV